MKTVLFYFSGRGNSLKAAIDLSHRLGDAAVVPIRHDTDLQPFQDATRIGIIVPVIDLGIPQYVLRFLNRLKAYSPDTCVFAVAANGGMPCASLTQLEKSLRKNGLRLSYGFLLKCGMTTPDDWEKNISQIADAVLQGQKSKPETAFKDRFLTAAGHSAARLLIPSEDKKFQVSGLCNGCGICVKICPVGNIRLVQDKPAWLHFCEQCAACFNWCPREAITGTNLASRTRFTNPDITLKQMLQTPSPEAIQM